MIITLFPPLKPLLHAIPPSMTSILLLIVNIHLCFTLCAQQRIIHFTYESFPHFHILNFTILFQRKLIMIFSVTVVYQYPKIKYTHTYTYLVFSLDLFRCVSL
ncbi:hypothetical protein CROQUDRAFT_569966 [Cronartium quercuum f. sp. fusiforme G11]|uniref:Uncharacterized protein n=1 Tax=Cronartium quercuum f. sp. fusiforme G11 TaxID=708437 RepID=A0A9P6NT54_9BASI|nr:hypothetical protein CROQUDRAFT_569966 [Cronartium quercuum f. sp. fusiforme G11]